MSYLEISGLCKSFADNKKEIAVIDNISFAVEKGEFICVSGRSGCGKTTLLRCLSGFESATSGEVMCNNVVIRNPKMKYAMVFQDFNQLLPWKTVKQNIMYPLELSNRGSKREREIEVENYLDIIGLREFADFYPHKLSGGMKQRTAIARAIAMNPEIIYMDEPFSSVDSQTKSALHKELLGIWKKMNITILFVTHNIIEAIHLSTRVMVMSDKPSNIILDIANPVKGERHPNDEGYSEFWELLNNSIKTAA